MNKGAGSEGQGQFREQQSVQACWSQGCMAGWPQQLHLYLQLTFTLSTLLSTLVAGGVSQWEGPVEDSG